MFPFIKLKKIKNGYDIKLCCDGIKKNSSAIILSFWNVIPDTSLCKDIIPGIDIIPKIYIPGGPKIFDTD